MSDPTGKPPAVRGDIARAVRLAHGLRPGDVSTATGIHPTTLSLIEHGRRVGRPHLGTLADHLGVPRDVLAGHAPALPVLMGIAGADRDRFAADARVTVDQLAEWESGVNPPRRTARKLARMLCGDEQLWTVFTLTASSEVAA